MKTLSTRMKTFLFFMLALVLTSFASFAHAEDVGITLPGFTTLFSAITTLIGSLVGVAAAILAYKMVRRAMANG